MRFTDIKPAQGKLLKECEKLRQSKSCEQVACSFVAVQESLLELQAGYAHLSYCLESQRKDNAQAVLEKIHASIIGALKLLNTHFPLLPQGGKEIDLDWAKHTPMYNWICALSEWSSISQDVLEKLFNGDIKKDVLRDDKKGWLARLGFKKESPSCITLSAHELPYHAKASLLIKTLESGNTKMFHYLSQQWPDVNHLKDWQYNKIVAITMESWIRKNRVDLLDLFEKHFKLDYRQFSLDEHALFIAATLAPHRATSEMRQKVKEAFACKQQSLTTKERQAAIEFIKQNTIKKFEAQSSAVIVQAKGNLEEIISAQEASSQVHTKPKGR